jgi:signal transduction histidine kinase
MSSFRLADRLRTHATALLRGPALFDLALVGLALLVITTVTRACAWLAPVRHGRRLVNVYRWLAGRWSGIEVPEPYLPAPPPPTSCTARLEWINTDPATERDDLYLLFNPIVAGVLGLLPVGLLAAGAYAETLSPPIPGLSVAAALIGAGIAPALVRLHGRWTALLLRPSGRPPRADAAMAVIRCVTLFGLSLLGLAIGLAVVAGLALSVGLGLVFLFPPLVEHSRWLPSLRRHLTGVWSGVDVPEPYAPRPDPPEPDPDGRYRDLGATYRTPRMPAFNRRWGWLFKDPATWRDLGWMLLDPLITGPLVAVPAVLAGYGVFALVVGIIMATDTDASALAESIGASDVLVSAEPGLSAGLGIAMMLAGLALARPAVNLVGRWTALLLRPTASARLALRVRRLTETRTDAIDTQAAELRRIERDLHDGAQARLVAVGLSLGAIEALVDRDPASAKELLAQARETSARALADLRELVRGIHPPVLAERGLPDAVRALALDSPLPVSVTVQPGLADRRPEPAVESAAYFAVAEALTNVARHADAPRADVELGWSPTGGGMLRMVVVDAGRGGAVERPDGGLAGIRRRLGTFDGTLAVASPTGGPTTLTMEIPCALSSPRTSPS